MLYSVLHKIWRGLSENFEKPSDIQGLIYIPFQTKVDDVAISLIRELSRQGYSIDSTRI